MKKIALLLLAALLLFTTACSGGGGAVVYPTDDTYHPETDDPFYNTYPAYPFVAETENGCYFMLDDSLLYADTDTMEPVYVCASPECLHSMEPNREKMDKVRETCTAYFRLVKMLTYLDGSLYVLHETSNWALDGVCIYTLTRVSADGSVRKEVLSLEEDEWSARSCIHRGRFYVVTQSSDEYGNSEAKLWSYSLDDPNEERQLLYQTGKRTTTQNIVSRLCAYGNRLYLTEYLHDYDDETGSVAALRIYDLTTGEWTVMENPEGYYQSVSLIYNEKLLCTYANLASSIDYEVSEENPRPDVPMMVYELDGSGGEEVACDDWGALTSDGLYLYRASPVYSVMGSGGLPVTNAARSSLSFYDSEGDLVDEMPFSHFVRDDYDLVLCTVYPTRGDKIPVYVRYRKIESFWYIDRDEIGTGSITPVEFLCCELLDHSYADNGGPRG